MRYGADQLGGLKLMNVGSDVVTATDAQQWYATGLPGRFLCNYGPTEATVTCFLHPVPAEPDARPVSGTLPIGRPVPGTRAYVLNADLQLVPVGVPGELCLGGVRLARGYHARPALTADRFVPDPFAASPGERLYRTGDLVRYQSDGTVEFLGRIDQQVKIRGLRIELGEIEAALLRLPVVREAAVVTVPAPAEERRIAAYLVCQPGAEPSVADLRSELRTVLPEYMVPSLWTMLDQLPVTSSGKLDRKALPAPTQPTVDIGVPPRNPTEQVITEIWQQVLDRNEIGVQDDFFALGGHSLLATRVLAQLRATFAIDLPLRRLFEATTVAELAGVITTAVEEDIAQLSDAQVAELLSREGADR
jgi:acyl-CoA synthetase (AMP-forming)/AMP-acid ligase II/acyl carrier protein